MTPFVWSLDGRYLAVTTGACPDTYDVSCERMTGNVAVLDGPTGDLVRSYPHVDYVLGFRGDDLVVNRKERDNPRVLLLSPDGREQTLVQLPGVVNLWMPRDLVERGTFGGPDAYPSPEINPLIAVPILAVAGSLGYLIWRRRR